MQVLYERTHEVEAICVDYERTGTVYGAYAWLPTIPGPRNRARVCVRFVGGGC